MADMIFLYLIYYKNTIIFMQVDKSLKIFTFYLKFKGFDDIMI